MEIDLKLGCRARELFYYLKGGKVDYGEEHSRVFGHSQFGRLYEQGQLGFVLSSGFVLFLFFFSSNNNQLYSQILYNIDGY